MRNYPDIMILEFHLGLGLSLDTIHIVVCTIARIVIYLIAHVAVDI